MGLVQQRADFTHLTGNVFAEPFEIRGISRCPTLPGALASLL